MNRHFESIQDSETKPRKQTIQSVSRALQIVDVVAKTGRSMLAKEISYDIGLNLGTCYHLLNTLVEEGYLTKDRFGAYWIGHQIPFLYNAYTLGLSASRPLDEIAFNLRNETRETVYVGGLVGDLIIITSIFESPQALKVSSLHVGYHNYPHARAMTKGLLAFWPRHAALDYLRQHARYEKLTQFTPTNEEEVVEELNKARQDGYLVDQQEFALGIHGVLFPIFSADGEVKHGIGIALPTERFKEKHHQIIESLSAAARQASRILGHRA